MVARLFVPTSRLVEPALVAEANHFVDEDLLLLVVEARKQRLGGVRHRVMPDNMEALTWAIGAAMLASFATPPPTSAQTPPGGGAAADPDLIPASPIVGQHCR